MSLSSDPFEHNTFVNCPFDEEYRATGRRVHGASRIWQRFSEFQSHLKIVLNELGFSAQEIEDLEVAEFTEYAREWIRGQEG